MTRRCFLALPLAFALVAPLASAADGNAITVFAAASLREAFENAAPAFTKKTGIAVAFDFGGSDTLATQIVQGAPADVFASANPKQMQVVVDAGLTAATPQAFARNELVLIVPVANLAHVNAWSDLAKPGVKVVLAAAKVPVGTYARAAFAKLAAHPGYSSDFAAAVEKNVVSNELDVKAVATKIALGEGDAGIVYSTDVTPAIAAKVHTLAIPRDTTPDAVYPIAALKNAPNGAGARAFVMYVLGGGQAALRARGFLTP